MSKDFVRKILNTKVTGMNKEPLYTNKELDLLADDKDVYVRHKDKYKKITGTGGTGGSDTEVSSKSKYITVEKNGSDFSLSTPELEKEIADILEKLTVNSKDYLGDYNDLPFVDVVNNNETKELIAHGSVGFDSAYEKHLVYDKGTGRINGRVPDKFADQQRLNVEIKMNDLEKVARKNIYFNILNMNSRDLPIKFKKSTVPIETDDMKIRNENDIDYKEGDIQAMANTITKLKMTVYSGNNGEILRTYIRDVTFD